MDKLYERRKQSWDSMFYSIQRIDLLIVSICGAGIYVCLETTKFLASKNLSCSILIKISGAFFLGGIILNFISQQLGLKANEQDYLMCDAMIDANDEKLKKSKKIEIKQEINFYDKKSECFSKYTVLLNYLSMVAMFTGLILILIYFSITF